MEKGAGAMTYSELKNDFYGIEVDATELGITYGVTMLKCRIKPQYLLPIEIHICGNNAYLIF
jgi:hypothetical protein